MRTVTKTYDIYQLGELSATATLDLQHQNIYL